MTDRQIGTYSIEPIEQVRPSTYNPRKADGHRLNLVALSLQKLGWLIPSCATISGEILSGHQRHLMAERLGATRVPVLWTRDMDLEKRKAVNILFNRATNDMARADTSTSITGQLDAQMDRLEQIAQRLPDKDVTGDEWFPCVHRRQVVKMAPLLDRNAHNFNRYAAKVANLLLNEQVKIPLILRRDNSVVNGIGRLEAEAERRTEALEAVYITDEEAELAQLTLNLLSMDFSIHERYADTLRFNSFRRPRGLKKNMGVAFLFDCFGLNISCEAVNLVPEQPKTVQRWKQHYGTTVLDFGAGLLDDTNRLRNMGVDCVPFEPFYLKPGTHDIWPDGARRIVRDFLKRVADGTKFSSIFQNAIMNSVPFHEDRVKIVRLIAALSSRTTCVHAIAAESKDTRWKQVESGQDYASAAENFGFALDYEPRIILDAFQVRPKVQKYHTIREWYDLWATGFHWVNAVSKGGTLCTVKCRSPKSFTPEQLAEAIEFEFDLPYPDGSRLGLVDEAKGAFGERLNVQIP